MDPTSVRVVFMGSPAFAQPALRALNHAGYLIPLVVTQPDRPAGRGSRMTPPPVKVLAEELGLEVFQPETLKSPEVEERIRAAEPQVLVVAAYGKIIPRSILDIPSRGSLNVHASLLPRWRGASPIATAILEGDDVTGVSIMEVVAKMDAGPVVARIEVPIEPHTTTRTLEPLLAGRGAGLLVDVMPGWFDGSIVAEPQDDDKATYCSLIKKEDGHIPAGVSAVRAERMVRAFDPWPGAYVLYGEARLGIWRGRVEPLPEPVDEGMLILRDREPAVAFNDGLLVLEEVQRQGSKRLTGREFVNGERGQLLPKVVLR